MNLRLHLSAMLTVAAGCHSPEAARAEVVDVPIACRDLALDGKTWPTAFSTSSAGLTARVTVPHQLAVLFIYAGERGWRDEVQLIGCRISLPPLVQLPMPDGRIAVPALPAGDWTFIAVGLDASGTVFRGHGHWVRWIP